MIKSLVCFAFLAAAMSMTVKVDGAGASFPRAAHEAWSSAFNGLSMGKVEVTYESTGSGEGQRRIKADEVVYAGSDSLLSEQDYTDFPSLVMLPIIAGGIVIGSNVPELGETPLKLSQDVAAKIFLGSIDNWSHPDLVADNPLLANVNQAIQVVVRQDKSGSTEVLTKALSSFSEMFKNTIGGSSQPTWPTFTPAAIEADGSSAMSDAISNNMYSIGYTSLNDAIEDEINVASVQNKKGEFVAPNGETIPPALTSALEAIEAEANGPLERLAFDVVDASEGYPIATFSYMIVKADFPSGDCMVAEQVARYFHWILTSYTADQLASAENFVPVSIYTAPNVAVQSLRLIKSFTCNANPLPFSFDTLAMSTEYNFITTPIGVSEWGFVVPNPSLENGLVPWNIEYMDANQNGWHDDGEKFTVNTYGFYAQCTTDYCGIFGTKDTATWFDTMKLPNTNTIDPFVSVNFIKVFGLGRTRYMTFEFGKGVARNKRHSAIVFATDYGYALTALQSVNLLK